MGSTRRGFSTGPRRYSMWCLLGSRSRRLPGTWPCTDVDVRPQSGHGAAPAGNQHHPVRFPLYLVDADVTRMRQQHIDGLRTAPWSATTVHIGYRAATPTQNQRQSRTSRAPTSPDGQRLDGDRGLRHAVGDGAEDGVVGWDRRVPVPHGAWRCQPVPNCGAHRSHIRGGPSRRCLLFVVAEGNGRPRTFAITGCPVDRWPRPIVARAAVNRAGRHCWYPQGSDVHRDFVGFQVLCRESRRWVVLFPDAGRPCPGCDCVHLLAGLP